MVKVLVCGDVKGCTRALYERVNQLNGSSHGPFDVLFCVGNFFPISKEYLDGTLRAPIPTYCISGDSMDSIEKEGQMVDNIYYLGTHGIQNIMGLNVAYLSGKYDSQNYYNANPLVSKSWYNVTQLNELESLATTQEIDLLLTCEYGKGFYHLVPGDLLTGFHQVENIGNEVIASLCTWMKPRYHFAGTEGKFFCRPPYVTEQDSFKYITRFIGLGHVRSQTDKSTKWIHALNLTPISQLGKASVDQIPAQTTVNPYTLSTCNKQQEQEQEQKETFLNQRKRKDMENDMHEKDQHQFFFQTTSHEGRQPHQNRKKSEFRARNDALVTARSECWFCLANPNVEKHLIVSVGLESYLALAKGGIVPEHILIIPLVHSGSSGQLTSSALTEITQYKQALQKYFASQGLIPVVFERNITTKGTAHCHMQVIPIPQEAANSARKAFHEEGKQFGISFQELQPDENIPTDEQSLYLYIEILQNSLDKENVRLLHLVQGHHPLFFARQVLANLLQIPKRKDWKFCVIPQPQEEARAMQFKKNFLPFDFSLDLM